MFEKARNAPHPVLPDIHHALTDAALCTRIFTCMILIHNRSCFYVHVSDNGAVIQTTASMSKRKTSKGRCYVNAVLFIFAHAKILVRFAERIQ